MRIAWRRFGSLCVLALASTCKEYAAGLAREVRRATALALPLPRVAVASRRACRFAYPHGLTIVQPARLLGATLRLQDGLQTHEA